MHPLYPLPQSNEEWNQMQSQEEDVVTEQDLELIKERETAIRQLEVRTVRTLAKCMLLDRRREAVAQWKAEGPSFSPQHIRIK